MAGKENATERKLREAWEKRPRLEPIDNAELFSRGLFILIYKLVTEKPDKSQVAVVRDVNLAYQKAYPECFAAECVRRKLTPDELVKNWPFTRQAISNILRVENPQRTMDKVETMDAIACYRQQTIGQLYDDLIAMGRHDAEKSGLGEPLPIVHTTSAIGQTLEALDKVQEILEQATKKVEQARNSVVGKGMDYKDLQSCLQSYDARYSDLRPEFLQAMISWDDGEGDAGELEPDEAGYISEGRWRELLREPGSMDDDEAESIAIAVNAMEDALGGNFQISADFLIALRDGPVVPTEECPNNHKIKGHGMI